MTGAGKIEPRHDLTAAEIEWLEARLYEHNRLATGCDDGAGLAFTAADEDGRIIGAVAGYTWAGVSEIRQVWVDPAHRRRGLGRALMRAAIEEARSRGCQAMYLATYSFQAPWLYESLGFERIARFADWPRGHANLVMRKAL